MSNETERLIREMAERVFERAAEKRAVRADDFAMDGDPERVAVREAVVRRGDERLRVAKTEAWARPPFEWLVEVTSEIGEADYFKHYLIRESGIVLAQRKVLTPLDAREAEVLLGDLREAEEWLNEGE